MASLASISKGVHHSIHRPREPVSYIGDLELIVYFSSLLSTSYRTPVYLPELQYREKNQFLEFSRLNTVQNIRYYYVVTILFNVWLIQLQSHLRPHQFLNNLGSDQGRCFILYFASWTLKFKC